jgi:hypothetical protein
MVPKNGPRNQFVSVGDGLRRKQSGNNPFHTHKRASPQSPTHWASEIADITRSRTTASTFSVSIRKEESLRACAGWVVLEDPFKGYVEDVRDPESDFERRRVLIALYGDDSLTRDIDAVGKLLLRHGVRGPVFADGVAEGGLHTVIR